MVSAQTPLTDVVTTAKEIEVDGRVAAAMRPVIEGSFGRKIPIRFEFWDGSKLNPPDQTVATLRFLSPDAIRRLLWMPNELGLGRAYVAGDIDLDGDLFDVVTAFRDAKPEVANPGRAWRVLPTAVAAAKKGRGVGRTASSAT